MIIKNQKDINLSKLTVIALKRKVLKINKRKYNKSKMRQYKIKVNNIKKLNYYML